MPATAPVCEAESHGELAETDSDCPSEGVAMRGPAIVLPAFPRLAMRTKSKEQAEAPPEPYFVPPHSKYHPVPTAPVFAPRGEAW